MKETNTITHFCNEGLYISILAKHCIHFLCMKYKTLSNGWCIRKWCKKKTKHIFWPHLCFFGINNDTYCNLKKSNEKNKTEQKPRNLLVFFPSFCTESNLIPKSSKHGCLQAIISCIMWVLPSQYLRALNQSSGWCRNHHRGLFLSIIILQISKGNFSNFCNVCSSLQFKSSQRQYFMRHVAIFAFIQQAKINRSRPQSCSFKCIHISYLFDLCFHLCRHYFSFLNEKNPNKIPDCLEMQRRCFSTNTFYCSKVVVELAISELSLLENTCLLYIFFFLSTLDPKQKWPGLGLVCHIPVLHFLENHPPNGLLCCFSCFSHHTHKYIYVWTVSDTWTEFHRTFRHFHTDIT